MVLSEKLVDVISCRLRYSLFENNVIFLSRINTGRIMEATRKGALSAVEIGLLIDSFVAHTGDDIAIIASHTNGKDNTDVHQFAWNTFLEATEIARQYGLYGSGQDLLFT
jgi:fructose 1,6-bisphosphatase